MRKLLALTFLLVVVLSCAKPEERVVRGGVPRDLGKRERSARRIESTSLREFGTDWKDRYSEKTLKELYGFSDRQLETAKHELRRKKPFLATKATQGPTSFPTPETVE